MEAERRTEVLGVFAPQVMAVTNGRERALDQMLVREIGILSAHGGGLIFGMAKGAANLAGSSGSCQLDRQEGFPASKHGAHVRTRRTPARFSRNFSQTSPTPIRGWPGCPSRARAQPLGVA